MHRPTRLDTQQSECQNSLEHTFFSPCSPNITLKEGNLESRPPIYYFIVMKAPKKKKRTETTQIKARNDVSVGRNSVSTSWVNGGGVDNLKSRQEQMRRKRARSTTETIERRTNWSCMEPAQSRLHLNLSAC